MRIMKEFINIIIVNAKMVGMEMSVNGTLPNFPTMNPWYLPF